MSLPNKIINNMNKCSFVILFSPHYCAVVNCIEYFGLLPITRWKFVRFIHEDIC